MTERAIFLIDKQGVIRYIDLHDSDDLPDNDVLFKEIRKIDPHAEPAPELSAEGVELPHGGIVMYCSKWCVDCRKARDWFDEHGLEYTDVDVYKTPGAVEQARKWGDGSLITPTFDIDGTIVLDFDKDRLKEILGL